MPQGRLTVFVTPSNKPQDFAAKVLRFVVFLFPVVDTSVYGGARRDRTVDLLRARQALSQLSYGPFREPERMALGQANPMALHPNNGGPG